MSNRPKYFIPKTDRFLGAWKQITKEPEILKIVEGYSIRFQQITLEICSPPPSGNLSEGQIVAIDKEIANLLKKGTMKLCSHIPGESVSNIFTIPKKSGGSRPVIDMRALNKFIKYILFRMKDISQLKSVLKQGDFMAKLGFRDAYLTVPVDKKIYLRFVWRGMLYQFTCLPFGLYFFGRVFMKPVIAFLRVTGIRLLIFLGDILIIAFSAIWLL